MRIYIIFLAFILVALYLTYDFIELRAVCMKLKKWTLYVNTNNCGFCLKQIEFLGTNAQLINIVHCDDKNNIRECSNLQEMPQWRNGNKYMPGARLSIYSLKQLIEK